MSVTAECGGTPVCVVEDDAALRAALLLLFAGADLPAHGYESGEALLAGEGGTHPLCVLTDVRLPGMDGLALLRHVLATRAGSSVVMMTGHADVKLAVAALKAGAADFLVKPLDPVLLIESARAAAARVDECRRLRTDEAERAEQLRRLTARERQIFEMLIDGHPNKVVAYRLGISVRTAEHHRARILDKIGARTRPALSRYAAAAG